MHRVDVWGNCEVAIPYVYNQRKLAKKRKPAQERTCRGCGKVFETRHKDKPHCNEHCIALAASNYKLAHPIIRAKDVPITPQEVEARTEAIKAGWTEIERGKRLVVPETVPFEMRVVCVVLG